MPDTTVEEVLWGALRRVILKNLNASGIRGESLMDDYDARAAELRRKVAD